MIQNVIRSVGGIAGFGIISICIFFTVFTTAMIWAFAQRKTHCDQMGSLPLNDGNTIATTEASRE
ncbi:MAG: hypothetical protein JWM99_4097 [Verrucomicrobiales bacterium]|nr:hypothetical protein [Verrucomicrobiales bacterium]